MRTLCQDSSFGYEDLSMRERCRLVRAAGFDAISLSWLRENFEHPQMPDHCLDYPEIAREAGLEVDNVHCEYPSADDIWRDDLAGRAYFELISRTITECGKANIGKVIFHPATDPIGGLICREGLERIKRLAALAEDNGVCMAVENIRNAEHLNFVLSNIDSPNVGFCYDIGHQHCFAHYAPILERFGERLAVLHLHDNHGITDEHLLPFDGTVDWNAFYETMKKLAWRGPVELESMTFSYKHGEYPNPEDYLAEAYRRAVIIRDNLED